MPCSLGAGDPQITAPTSSPGHGCSAGVTPDCRGLGSNCLGRPLRLDRTAAAPYGAISWPADTDKQGRTWRDVPLSPAEIRDCLL